MRAVLPAYQTDHGTPGPELQSELKTLGVVIAHVFGHPAAATQRPQVFDSSPAKVRGRLRDRGGQVRAVRRKSECPGQRTL